MQLTGELLVQPLLTYLQCSPHGSELFCLLKGDACNTDLGGGKHTNAISVGHPELGGGAMVEVTTIAMAPKAPNVCLFIFGQDRWSHHVTIT